MRLQHRSGPAVGFAALGAAEALEGHDLRRLTAALKYRRLVDQPNLSSPSLSSTHAQGILANLGTPGMKIALIFLPLYFGLIVGGIGRSLWLGLAGATFGMLLALLLRRERPDTGMTAIDTMSGVEFEGYVAARLRRAGWQVEFTSATGDYGVDLIAEKDGQCVAIQCKRLGKSVGVAAVQQVVSGAVHHGCTRSIVVSNQEFTTAARQLAYTHRCQLIGRRALQAWVPPPAQTAT
ncbi:restriction endonuclease [Mycobacterium sp.]|uniref:restriction endonuclease n=1 Tax=Mycobacterium sp. TaxID=1785 RepID=UPI002D7998AE|nr:restriction endonuclease [Mycobacterium sp.]